MGWGGQSLWIHRNPYFTKVMSLNYKWPPFLGETNQISHSSLCNLGGLWLCYLSLKSVPTLYLKCSIMELPTHWRNSFNLKRLNHRTPNYLIALRGIQFFSLLTFGLTTQSTFYQVWIYILQALKDVIYLVKLSDEWINSTMFPQIVEEINL